MKTLIKNGKVINVFTKEIEKLNILIEDDKIIGTGDYCDADADIVNDVKGKYVCPGFIDGHIHIESTMLLPSELARVCVPHGTTSIVADPHEIANVCGKRPCAWPSSFRSRAVIKSASIASCSALSGACASSDAER